MSVMLDIIGSMVIRGAIVLMTLYLSVGLQSAYTYKSTLYIVKQKTVIPAEVLTDDIRLAGYGPTGTKKTFDIASSQEIEFPADIYNTGFADQIHYYLGFRVPWLRSSEIVQGYKRRERLRVGTRRRFFMLYILRFFRKYKERH